MKLSGLIVLTLLLTLAVTCEATEKTYLTGIELAERLSNYEVLAGVAHETGIYFMVFAYTNGTREVYWNHGIKSGTDTGTHQIVQDQVCVVWKNSFEG